MALFCCVCLLLRLVLLLLIVDCLCVLLFIDVCLLVCYEFVVVDLFVWCYVYLSAFRFFVWPTHCVFRTSCFSFWVVRFVLLLCSVLVYAGTAEGTTTTTSATTSATETSLCEPLAWSI
jgi:hypothetical protein